VTEKVYEHFRMGEYIGSADKPTLGHYYNYKNDPIGHGTHVHFGCMDPWDYDDGPRENPGNPKNALGSPGIRAFVLAFKARFPEIRWAGTYVRKHRNSDPNQKWSQHAMVNKAGDGGNAVDFFCTHEQADEIDKWFNGPWEEEDLNDEQAAQLKEVYDFIVDLKGGGDEGISADALASNGDFIRGFRNRYAFESGADTSLKRPTDLWAGRGWDAWDTLVG